MRSPEGIVIEIWRRDPFASVIAPDPITPPKFPPAGARLTLILELCGIASSPFLVALTTTSQTPKSFFVILFFSRSHPSDARAATGWAQRDCPSTCG